MRWILYNDATHGSKRLFSQHLGYFDDQFVWVLQLGRKICLCSANPSGPHNPHDGIICIRAGCPRNGADEVPFLVIDKQRSERRVDRAVGEQVDRHLDLDHHALVLGLVPGEPRSEWTGGRGGETKRLAREICSGDRLGYTTVIRRFEGDGRLGTKRVAVWLVRLPVCPYHPIVKRT